MKVPDPEGHSGHVRTQAAARDLIDAEPAAMADFSVVYDRFFQEVVRWCRAMGVPATDVEDIAQEVFVVVARRLSEFQGENLAGWIYRITSLTVRRMRRRPWYKYLFARRAAEVPDTFAWVGAGPVESLELRQAQAILADLLARMSEKRRTAFILFEIEGYTGDEIATLENIPVATVWTRLFHARKEFTALAKAHADEQET